MMPGLSAQRSILRSQVRFPTGTRAPGTPASTTRRIGCGPRVVAFWRGTWKTSLLRHLAERNRATATITDSARISDRGLTVAREEIETMQTLPASAEQCLGLASAATCEEVMATAREIGPLLL
eukprot:s7236_g3.t1